MKFLLVFSLYFTLWNVCHTSVVEETLQAIRQSNWEFTSSMYKAKSMSAEASDNIIFSPLSLQVILALIYMGAGGETAKQLLNGLHLPKSPDDIKIQFQRLLELLATQTNTSLEMANTIFPNVRYPVLKNFKDVAKEFFLTKVENIDYNSSSKAAEIINEWVEQKTHNKITNVVSGDGLNVDTAMVLSNAVFFNGVLQNHSDRKKTYTGEFYVSGNVKTNVEMMYCRGVLHHMNNLDIGANVLELNYTDKTTSLFIVLPLANETLSRVEAKLSKMNLPKVLETHTKVSRRVRISLPRFTLDQSSSLNELLTSMGMGNMFKKNVADFRNITLEKGIHVDMVGHKTMIEVKELDEVPLVISVKRVWLFLMKFLGFKVKNEHISVERPFLFVVMSRKARVVLLMGRFTGAGGDPTDTQRALKGQSEFLVDSDGSLDSGSSELSFGHLFLWGSIIVLLKITD